MSNDALPLGMNTDEGSPPAGATVAVTGNPTATITPNEDGGLTVRVPILIAIQQGERTFPVPLEVSIPIEVHDNRVDVAKAVIQA